MNPVMYLTSCARFDKLLCQCNTMTNTWEDVTWEEEHSLKEWVVEYIAKVSEDSTHHLTVIHGADMEDVQKQLMLELRTTYMEASEIEVTVLRMEEIETEPNAFRFNDTFTP